MVVVKGIEADAQIAKTAGKAHTFEAGVEGPLGYRIVRQGIQYIGRYFLAAGKIDYLHRAGVDAEPE